ncbi:pentapeptide repeat-containing protein [Streptomyces sp. NPDC056738]|uniref:pentapeptide repeat-containing protein n=1 Tax=Streptomyces sp. NPDC056738 TaxID=3345933 RepID=UPI0036B97A60
MRLQLRRAGGGNRVRRADRRRPLREPGGRATRHPSTACPADRLTDCRLTDCRLTDCHLTGCHLTG